MGEAMLMAWKSPGRTFIKKEAFAIDCHAQGLRGPLEGVLQVKSLANLFYFRLAGHSGVIRNHRQVFVNPCRIIRQSLPDLSGFCPSGSCDFVHMMLGHELAGIERLLCS
jgi:hypothetical protein